MRLCMLGVTACRIFVVASLHFGVKLCSTFDNLFLWSEQQVNQKLEELMLRAFQQVRHLARERKLRMRTAALSLGVQKVAKEKMRRGLYP